MLLHVCQLSDGRIILQLLYLFNCLLGIMTDCCWLCMLYFQLVEQHELFKTQVADMQNTSVLFLVAYVILMELLLIIRRNKCIL